MTEQLEHPCSNTGSKCLNELNSTYSVGIDWLQGILEFDDQDSVRSLGNYLASLTQDEFPWADDFPWFCGVRWQHSVSSIRGVRVAWNECDDESGQKVKVLLSLTGDFFSRFKLGEVWQVCYLLNLWNFKATRFDARIDDFSKQISFDLINSAAVAENFSGFLLADPRRPIRRKSINLKSKRVIDDGWTYYFGSPSSDKRLRIYDKSAESNGEIDAIRLEIQYRDERAIYCFLRFVQEFSPDELGEDFEELASQYLASLVTGSISFCDMKSANRQDKRVLLPWWEKFLERIAYGIKVPSNRPKPTADVRLRYYFRNAASFVTLYKGLGDKFADFFDELIEAGTSKLSETHRSFINVMKSDFPMYRKGIYYTCPLRV